MEYKANWSILLWECYLNQKSYSSQSFFLFFSFLFAFLDFSTEEQKIFIAANNYIDLKRKKKLSCIRFFLRIRIVYAMNPYWHLHASNQVVYISFSLVRYTIIEVTWQCVIIPRVLASLYQSSIRIRRKKKHSHLNIEGTFVCRLALLNVFLHIIHRETHIHCAR